MTTTPNYSFDLPDIGAARARAKWTHALVRSTFPAHSLRAGR